MFLKYLKGFLFLVLLFSHLSSQENNAHVNNFYYAFMIKKMDRENKRNIKQICGSMHRSARWIRIFYPCWNENIGFPD